MRCFWRSGVLQNSEETDPLGLLAVQIGRHLVALRRRRRAIAATEALTRTN